MSNQIKDPIFLCGMMGAGKTTTGQPLAKKLQVPFIDLDRLIETHEGMPIPEIFKLKKEDYFRTIERKILIDLTDDADGVIALGGGALQSQYLVDHIKLNGWLVYLKPATETLTERLKEASGRPMISGEDAAGLKRRIHTLLDERTPFYDQAHVIVETGALSSEEIADLIIKKLSVYEK